MTEETAIEVRKPDATAIVPDARNIRLLATDLFNSKMFRGIETVPQAVAVIQFGSEVGIGPIQALTNIKPIKGQMTMSAKLIMGLAASKGLKWRVVENTNKRCEIVFQRPGWDPITSVFTIEEAMLAGLVRDDSGWAKYPQDMLFARAGSRGVRRIAPDLTFGLYSTEEMHDAQIIDGEVVGSDVDTPAKAPESPAEGFLEPTPTPDQGSDGSFPGEAEESISDIANKAEQEAEGKTPEMEAAIKAIKDKLEAEGVDVNSFKEWLFHYQNKIRPVRAYCGKIGRTIRFHLGKPEDVIKLSAVESMDKAIATFRTGK